ncbi:MAG: tRNA (adenosine(37)-N6)-threonylcarbamoyltransferase complex transferase subunit TsaD [Candidatus Beckwithbacteria bacterium]
MTEPLILAIDTSCDETCASVASGYKILSNIISSQINLHQPFGGVVPHLAKRAHEAKIDFVVKKALKQPTRRLLVGKLSAIAVTVGPGLAPALEVGINYAKNLSQKLNLPLIAINHLEGHLLSFLAETGRRQIQILPAQANSVPEQAKFRITEPMFPAIGLIVSGGHTQLVLVKKIGSYQLLGETLDDAAGEALDKLAKMLKLGYPGGPIIEQLAKKGDPDKIPLPIPMQYSNNLNFSFSGLKTAAMYLISKTFHPEVEFIYNLCAAFQQAIAKSLTIKLQKAINKYSPKSILLGGGVFSNLYLRRQIRKVVQLPLFLPKNQKLFTDNAAMIALAAHNHFLNQDFADPRKLDRQPNLNFTK